MAVKLSRSDFQKVIAFLTPFLRDEQQRRQLIEAAYFDTPLLEQLRLEQQARAFTVNFVNQALSFGEVETGLPALWLIFEEIHPIVGVDVQAQIDTFRTLIVGAPAQQYISTPQKVISDAYVFISYAHPDEEIAKIIESYLVDAGLKVFRDVTNIQPGDNWDLAIEQALDDCDVMVLLLSKHSMPNRKEVYREWIHFEQNRKYLIPIFLEDCELPGRLKRINYIDARSGLDAALQKILKAINAET